MIPAYNGRVENDGTAPVSLPFPTRHQTGIDLNHACANCAACIPKGTTRFPENGRVSGHKPPLNTAQMAVLVWVSTGCPEGVYSAWSHRVTARALHNRDLITIKGHGKTWSAALTEPGTHYLETGTYPGTGSTLQNGSAPEKRSDAAVRPPPTPNPRTPRPQTVQEKPPGPMDQMMVALHEAEGRSQIEAQYPQRRGTRS